MSEPRTDSDMPIMNPVFDQVATLRRMGYDQQLFREMIALILEDGPKRLQDVQDAFAANDAKKMHHAAHTLKGLAANFSAQRAMDAAALVERLARAGEWTDLRPAVTKLDDAVVELLAALQPLRRSAAPSGQQVLNS